jgi:hypothetical protein
VSAVDRDGRCVAGRFVLRDRNGQSREVRMSASGTVLYLGQPPRDRGAGVGKPGQLLPAEDNETYELLEPGDYELELDLGAHGIQRRRVTVRARQVTEVAIRLP